MELESLKAAEAAAKYILGDLFDYVYRTGDLAAWRSMCLPVSSFCSGVMNDVRELHLDGLWQDTGSVTFEASVSEWVLQDGEGRYVVEFFRVQTGTRLFDDQGNEIEKGYEFHERADLVVNLLYLDRGWVVRAVDDWTGS